MQDGQAGIQRHGGGYATVTRSAPYLRATLLLLCKWRLMVDRLRAVMGACQHMKAW